MTPVPPARRGPLPERYGALQPLGNSAGATAASARVRAERAEAETRAAEDARAEG